MDEKKALKYNPDKMAWVGKKYKYLLEVGVSAIMCATMTQSGMDCALVSEPCGGQITLDANDVKGYDDNGAPIIERKAHAINGGEATADHIMMVVKASNKRYYDAGELKRIMVETLKVRMWVDYTRTHARRAQDELDAAIKDAYKQLADYVSEQGTCDYDAWLKGMEATTSNSVDKLREIVADGVKMITEREDKKSIAPVVESKKEAKEEKPVVVESKKEAEKEAKHDPILFEKGEYYSMYTGNCVVYTAEDVANLDNLGYSITHIFRNRIKVDKLGDVIRDTRALDAPPAIIDALKAHGQAHYVQDVRGKWHQGTSCDYMAAELVAHGQVVGDVAKNLEIIIRQKVMRSEKGKLMSYSVYAKSVDVMQAVSLMPNDLAKVIGSHIANNTKQRASLLETGHYCREGIKGATYVVRTEYKGKKDKISGKGYVLVSYNATGRGYTTVVEDFCEKYSKVHDAAAHARKMYDREERRKRYEREAAKKSQGYLINRPTEKGHNWEAVDAGGAKTLITECRTLGINDECEEEENSAEQSEAAGLSIATDDNSAPIDELASTEGAQEDENAQEKAAEELLDIMRGDSFGFDYHEAMKGCDGRLVACAQGISLDLAPEVAKSFGVYHEINYVNGASLIERLRKGAFKRETSYKVLLDLREAKECEENDLPYVLYLHNTDGDVMRKAIIRPELVRCALQILQADFAEAFLTYPYAPLRSIVPYNRRDGLHGIQIHGDSNFLFPISSLSDKFFQSPPIYDRRPKSPLIIDTGEESSTAGLAVGNMEAVETCEAEAEGEVETGGATSPVAPPTCHVATSERPLVALPASPPREVAGKPKKSVGLFAGEELQGEAGQKVEAGGSGAMGKQSDFAGLLAKAQPEDASSAGLVLRGERPPNKGAVKICGAIGEKRTPKPRKVHKEKPCEALQSMESLLGGMEAGP